MPQLIATTKPGKKYRSLKRPRVYEALRRQGMSKERAARISNAQARKKSFTLDQLEAFVSSAHYDADTASLIALNIPALPSLKGEQIAPGITRIHGNLCNVHGRYGPCDKGLRGKPTQSVAGKKPVKGRTRKPAAPKKTEAQRAAERAQRKQEAMVARAQEHAANQAKVLQSFNIAPDGQQALEALRNGAEADPKAIERGGFVQAGLVEQARDGSYRLSASGRAMLSAAAMGDVGRAGSIISSARDRTTSRGERATAASERKRQAQSKREQAAQLRAKRLAQRGKKMTTKAVGSPGDYLIVEDPKLSSTWHLQVKRNGKPDHGLMGSAWAALHSGFRGNVYQGPNKGEAIAKLKKLYASERMDVPTTKAQTDAMVNVPQAITHLQQAMQLHRVHLSNPNAVPTRESAEAEMQHIQTALAALGAPIVTKSHGSFRVFKDASGRYRWVSQSSTAFQDRDKEIVSTKALADDCAFADKTGEYGPLRWWHVPGFDLGDCDFNAMHGRVLIESGTFRTPAIAQKVANAATELEISLGFLHLPTEPDASSVFHHIRRFERSLVPRGKASNRFTAFSVKDQSMANQFTPEKIAGLKAIGFTDEDIAGFSAQAISTEKTADGLLIASKADEPLPDVVINGVTYKAMPPMMQPDEETPAEDMAEGGMEEPGEEEPGGLTLSPEDLTAIGEAIAVALQGSVAQIMGALDLEKKVGAHVQGLMAPYTAQKDASDAEKVEAITALQTSLKAGQEQQTALKAQLDELLGLQPAVVQRPSESASTVVNPWQDQHLIGAIKAQMPADQQFEFGDLVTNLFGNINTPGQA